MKSLTTSLRVLPKPLRLTLMLLGSLCWALSANLLHAEESASPLFVDFVQYWSAGRALISGQNAYDPQTLSEIEKIALPDLAEPILQWNPPIIFPFTLPLAQAPFEVAEIFWLIIMVALLAWVFQQLLRHFKRGDRTITDLALLALALASFFPLWESIRFGQISPILLTGFCGFLFLFRTGATPSRRNDITAGTCLALTLLKPHLLYLVYLAVAWESCRTKRWALLTSFLAAGVFLGFLPMTIRQHVWLDYFAALKSMPTYFMTPTLGSWLQGVFNQSTAVRFAPSVLFGTILILFLWRRASNYLSEMELLGLSAVSLFTSPYGWVFDQILLLPLVVALLCVPRQKTMAACGIIAVNLIGFPWSGKTSMEWYVWYPAAIFLLFVVFASKSQTPFKGRPIGPTSQ